MEGGYDLFCHSHQAEAFKKLDSLRVREKFVDVILVAGEASFKAHKVVLSSCSCFFDRILSAIGAQLQWFGPQVVVLDDDSVKADLLELALQFIYSGQVVVPDDSLESFMSLAEKLEITGLVLNTGSSTATTPVPTSSSRKSSLTRSPTPVDKKPVLPSPKTEVPKSSSEQKQPGSSEVTLNGGTRNRRRNRVPVVDPHVIVVNDDDEDGYAPSSKIKRKATVETMSVPVEAVDHQLGLGGGYEVAEEDVRSVDLNEADLAEGSPEAEVDMDEEAMMMLVSEENENGEAIPDFMPSNIPPDVCTDKPVVRLDSAYMWTGVRESGTRLHFCTACGYSSTNRTNAVIHGRRHTGERPFGCKQCKRGFSSKGSLKKHLIFSHGSDAAGHL